MLFSYKAKSKTGEIIEGISDFSDRPALARDLRSRGYTPISISEKKKNFLNIISGFNRILGRVSVGEQIIFTKNLSGMLRAGLSLSRALSVLQKQTKNSFFNKILVSLSGDINTGSSLSEGLSNFPMCFQNFSYQ